jgi:hypothetical protein
MQKKNFLREIAGAISFRVVFDWQIRADFIFCGLLSLVFSVIP